jgi:hypothetical protein
MDLAAAKNKHNQSQFHGQIKNHPNGWPNNEGKNEKRATKNSVMRQHGAQTLQAGFRALNIVVLPIHFPDAIARCKQYSHRKPVYMPLAPSQNTA